MYANSEVLKKYRMWWVLDQGFNFLMKVNNMREERRNTHSILAPLTHEKVAIVSLVKRQNNLNIYCYHNKPLLDCWVKLKSETRSEEDTWKNLPHKGLHLNWIRGRYFGNTCKICSLVLREILRNCEQIKFWTKDLIHKTYSMPIYKF